MAQQSFSRETGSYLSPVTVYLSPVGNLDPVAINSAETIEDFLFLLIRRPDFGEAIRIRSFYAVNVDCLNSRNGCSGQRPVQGALQRVPWKVE